MMLLISKELTTAANTNPSISTSEVISNSGSLLARMRHQVTLKPELVFENQRTSKEYRTFTKQQRRLLRHSTSTSLFGTNLFETNNQRYSRSNPHSSRRVFIRPGNCTWLTSVFH